MLTQNQRNRNGERQPTDAVEARVREKRARFAQKNEALKLNQLVDMDVNGTFLDQGAPYHMVRDLKRLCDERRITPRAIIFVIYLLFILDLGI